MFPFTAGKMVSYEEVRSYLTERQVPQIFESIMTGLMYHRPDDHLTYMEQCLLMMRQKGMKDLSWNTFIECNLPKMKPLSATGQESDAENNCRSSPEVSKKQQRNSERHHAKHLTTSNSYKKMTSSLTAAEEFNVPNVPIIFVAGGPGTGVGSVQQKITYMSTIGYVCIGLVASVRECTEFPSTLRFSEIPSAVLVEHIMKEMQEFENVKAVIVVGYPRNVADVQSFMEMVHRLDSVLLLDYTEDTLREKMTNGSDLYFRDDESVDEQIDYFKTNTLPAIELAEKMGVLTLIDADDDENGLKKKILSAIDAIVEKHLRKETSLEDETFEIERKNIDMNAVKEAKIPIIFVLGGPGSGKGTQCDLIVQRYGFTHLSSGDLLRAEIKSGSSRGKQLNDSIEKGELVPMEVVLDLIKETMVNKLSSSKGYILDGYPREVIQGTKFEDEVCSCTLVIYFDVSDVTMTERLLNRGKTSGRVDDNEETIKKRLKTFHDLTKPVIDHYCGKVITISAEPEPEIVFQEVTKAIDSMNC